MPAPYQVATSTSTSTLDYAPEQRIAVLCDGSLLTSRYDGGTSAILTQITNPSGASPTMTDLAQTFSITASTNVVASLYVLNNGTTSSDVWFVYGGNNTNTALNVAHGTYTASGGSWSWDNTGTAVVASAAYLVPAIVWTGTTLIVLSRYFTGTVYEVGIWYTTTKAGNAGWSTLAVLSSTTSASSHFYPILLHDAANGCTLAVYSLQADHVVARVLPDVSTPAVANWSAEVTLSTATNINVGAANLTATLDPANKNLHVAWVNSSASPNPNYVLCTYTTTTITSGTPSSITGGGGTGATSPSVGLDSGGTLHLFWASAASGAASDISYVTIASPYASGNVSAVTNLTNASANDNVFPHVPQEAAFSGYVPLIYQQSAVSPYAILFDNTLTTSGGGVALSGTATAYEVTGGTLTPPNVALSGTAVAYEVASGALSGGTGIGDLAVTTKSQSWSGGPSGSPGTETDVTYTDATQSGWTWGFIPTYGADFLSPWYEVNNGVTSANQTSLATSFPDGAIHWLEQSPAANFAGSEDLPFTATELAPTSTAFRRYYQGTFGPDSNGFNWRVTACIYPGDPGMVALRFDCINPSGSPIGLAASDSLEIALIAGLEQADSTWAPANGFYGNIGGAPVSGWPSALTTVDPDYVGIAPAAGSGLSVGRVTVKQTAVSAFAPAWSNGQLIYLQNATRLKLKIQGTLTSFPASTTSTVYLLSALRRNLVAADAAAMAADYLAPGTPSASVGSYTGWSYDERLWTFAAANNALTATLDMSPVHVTVRYKPIIKVTNWTAAGAPAVAWGGAALTAGADYRYLVDATSQALYLQLYFDVVTSGAVSGQRNNAALSLSPAAVALSGMAAAYEVAGGTLTPPAVALTGSVAAYEVAAGALTPPAVALSGTVAAYEVAAGAPTVPNVALSGTVASYEVASGALVAAVLLSGTATAYEVAAGTLTAGVRSDNEGFTVTNVLLALSVILPQTTKLASDGGSVVINDDTTLLLDTAHWPALLIEQGKQTHKRVAPRTWQKSLTFTALYLARWDAESGVSLDTIWAAIADDVELMVANLTDNPTLTATLPGGSAPTRTCLAVTSIEPSPRNQKAVSDDYGPRTVQRLITITVSMPPYVTAG